MTITAERFSAQAPAPVTGWRLVSVDDATSLRVMAAGTAGDPPVLRNSPANLATPRIVRNLDGTPAGSIVFDSVQGRGWAVYRIGYETEYDPCIWQAMAAVDWLPTRTAAEFTTLPGYHNVVLGDGSLVTITSARRCRGSWVTLIVEPLGRMELGRRYPLGAVAVNAIITRWPDPLVERRDVTFRLTFPARMPIGLTPACATCGTRPGQPCEESHLFQDLEF